MNKIPTIQLLSRNEIPKLGLGTWMIGGAKQRDLANDDKAQIAGIRYAIDKGIKFIRTAENYAQGYCEKIIGKAIKAYDRNKLYIASCIHSGYPTKEAIVDHAKISLERLGIESFDLYLVGGVNPYIPIEDTAEGLLDILNSGITKDVGVTNFRLKELELIQKYTNNRIVYNEMHYNLIVREPEIGGELEYCQKNNIAFCAYRPLQLGQLGKGSVKLLDDIAKKYKKTSEQIALKWILSKDNVITIPKMLTKRHIDQNIEVFDFEIEKRDLTQLNRNFPIQMRLSDCCPPKQVCEFSLNI